MPENFKPELGAGDLGRTSLLGGKRVPKTHRRIKFNALLDELSALLGLLKTGVRDVGIKKGITQAQEGLSRAAGVIAGRKADLTPQTLALEKLIETLAAGIKPPKKFVLPGANETEALAHLARARARIAEILAWELKAKTAAVYLNRLSDYLFLVAIKTVKKQIGGRGVPLRRS